MIRRETSAETAARALELRQAADRRKARLRARLAKPVLKRRRFLAALLEAVGSDVSPRV